MTSHIISVLWQTLSIVSVAFLVMKPWRVHEMMYHSGGAPVPREGFPTIKEKVCFQDVIQPDLVFSLLKQCRIQISVASRGSMMG